jgi:hypothetical protein
MASLKIACWNIYYSNRLVSGDKINPQQKKRADAVAGIIDSLWTDIVGIVECMPKASLRVFDRESPSAGPSGACAWGTTRRRRSTVSPGSR